MTRRAIALDGLPAMEPEPKPEPKPAEASGPPSQPSETGYYQCATAITSNWIDVTSLKDASNHFVPDHYDSYASEVDNCSYWSCEAARKDGELPPVPLSDEVVADDYCCESCANAGLEALEAPGKAKTAWKSLAQRALDLFSKPGALVAERVMRKLDCANAWQPTTEWVPCTQCQVLSPKRQTEQVRGGLCWTCYAATKKEK